jgi:hypothetical protein
MEPDDADAELLSFPCGRPPDVWAHHFWGLSSANKLDQVRHPCRAWSVIRPADAARAIRSYLFAPLYALPAALAASDLWLSGSVSFIVCPGVPTECSALLR